MELETLSEEVKERITWDSNKQMCLCSDETLLILDGLASLVKNGKEMEFIFLGCGISAALNISTR